MKKDFDQSMKQNFQEKQILKNQLKETECL